MKVIGTNIISSLGFTTTENFENAKRGISGVKNYDAGTFDLPEAFTASLIDRGKLNSDFAKISPKNNYTELEKAVILSVFTANQDAQIDLSSEKTIFILSTTKGNVDLLDVRQTDARLLDKKNFNSQSLVSNNLKSNVYLWHTAKLAADFFGNKNTPIVVSNACISGAAAQITAMRELQSGNYDYAVVAGVDFLSKFIISGFQSFKALSPELCRPFDKDRCGLNLGEAAATIIFSRQNEADAVCGDVLLTDAAMRNDANHISAPSRTGEGAFLALRKVLKNNISEEIAFVNAHGTATPYNDEMEAVALTRADLNSVPTNSLKGYFGHTLGAAGVLESIISIEALKAGIALKTCGYENLGVGNQLKITRDTISVKKNRYIKMLSGFGGCNAVLLFTKIK